MRIAVVGTGYVGLTTGVCLASRGHDVLCIDSDVQKVAVLQRGDCPILEPGLEALMHRNVKLGRIWFDSSLDSLGEYSEVIFVAVGTPEGESGQPDLTYVRCALGQIATHAAPRAVVIIKSTVPPNALAGLAAELDNLAGEKQLSFAVNPEFLRQGKAVVDTLHPERIIVGTADNEARKRLLHLYAPFAVPLVVTDPVSAMTIKYVANSFLATKISFVNEVANLCELLGADVDAVTLGMGLDSRIGPKFLEAGIGFGGSCFPKDTVGLLYTARSLGYDFRVLASAVAVNDQQYRVVLDHLAESLGSLAGKKIAVLGLAFKAATDDTRETRSFPIVRALVSAGSDVSSYDTCAVLDRLPRDIRATIGDSLDSCISQADAVVVANDSPDWSSIDWSLAARTMRGRLIVDGRNTLDPDTVLEAGLEYVGVGRRATVGMAGVVARTGDLKA